MTLKSVKIELNEHLSEELREEADRFVHALCRRMNTLNEEDQRKLIAELNHFITFYDPGHLLRP